MADMQKFYDDLININLYCFNACFVTSICDMMSLFKLQKQQQKTQTFWQIWNLVIWFWSPTDVLKMNWKNSDFKQGILDTRLF